MATALKTVEQALGELPPDTLHAAMARAFAEIEAATKDATNPHFRTKYADLSSVIDAIKPALVGNGLFVTQRCQPSEGGVTVDTYVHHKSGNDMFLGSLFVPANKNDAQGFGSALTYAKRYALQTAFVVPTEDDDGNSATTSVREAAQQPAKAPPAPSRPVAEPEARTIDEAAVWAIQGLAGQAQVSAESICKRAGVNSLAELTEEQANSVVKKLKLTVSQRKTAMEDVLDDGVPY